MENQEVSEGKSRDERRAEKQAYRRARLTVGLRLGFFYHLAAYLVGNGLMFAINYLLTPQVWWATVPAVAWGIALALHGLSVLFFRGSGLRSRMIKRELEKELRRENAGLRP